LTDTSPFARPVSQDNVNVVVVVTVANGVLARAGEDNAPTLVQIPASNATDRTTRRSGPFDEWII
jgi:hypothetical protein